jgi:predicted nucleic acid-binding protein
VTFLADTNVLSELRKRQLRDPNVQAWIESVGWDSLSTSWVVIAEMRRGANLIRRRDTEQGRMIDAWVDYTIEQLGDRIHPIDGPVAEEWARLGIPHPLPTIDGLIAATALVHGLTLATRNIRDFGDVKVQIINPWTFAG